MDKYAIKEDIAKKIEEYKTKEELNAYLKGRMDQLELDRQLITEKEEVRFDF